MQLGNATALGLANNPVSVASGAVLDLSGQTVANNYPLTLNGTGIGGTGALTNSSNTAASYAGAVTLGSASTIGSTGTGNTLTVGGTVTGAQNLTINAGGTQGITLTNVNNTGTVTNSGAGTGTTTVTTLGSNVTGLTEAGASPLTVTNAVGLTSNLNTFTSTGSGLFTLAAQVTGAQNLTLSANSTGNITLTAGANNGGSISNNGSGTNTVTLGPIGALVTTGVTQNAANSILLLNGAGLYTGGTTITAGTLKVGNATALGANASTASVAGTGAALDLNGTTMTGTNALTLNGTGISSGGALTNSSATAGTYAGLITLGSASSIIAGSGNITLSNSGTISGATFGLTLGGAQNGSIASIIGTGTGTLTKQDAGTWTLSGTNTYSGKTIVQNGTLSFSVGNASATANQQLGANAALDLGVATTSSGILKYTGAAGTLAKNINALGNGSDTIQNSGSGLLTLAGTLTKNGTKLTLNGGTNGITVTGVIAGSSANSDLIITGGTTTLTNLETYNGPTYVQGSGKLVNGNSGGALPTGTTLYIGGADNSTGTFDLGGNGQTVAALNSQGTGGASNVVTNDGSSDATLTVSNGGTFAGKIQDGATKKTSLAVAGGTLALSGANNYTGTTTVSAGTLLVSNITGSGTGSGTVSVSGATLGGSGTVSGATTLSGATIGSSGSILTLSSTLTSAGASNVASGSTVNVAGPKSVTSGTLLVEGALGGSGTTTVSSGATIAGNGTVAGALAVSGGGFLAPGNSNYDTLTTTGSLSLADTATYQFQLNSSTLAADQVVASGVTLASGSVFNFTDLGSGTIAQSTVFVAINNTSAFAISGTFSGLAEGSTFTVGSNQFQASYVGGTGNDFTLTAVPEPATWALLAFSLTTVMVLRRRRNS